MFQMNGTRLRNQIKERLMIERVQPYRNSWCPEIKRKNDDFAE